MPNVFVGRYSNPDEVGGWSGWIEPDSKEWILFIPKEGKPLLFDKRDPETGRVLD